MSKTRDEMTRVTRFVFRVLSDGFSFLAYPNNGTRMLHWTFGVKCRNCGAMLTKQITDHALEDSMDMGHVVDAEMDAGRVKAGKP